MERRLIDCLPLGLLVIDQEFMVRRWNRWLVDKTGIVPQLAIGQDLRSLFPSLRNPRFFWAVEQVCGMRSPQILSQVLNSYLIPIPLQSANRHGLSMMQQQVHIEPLLEGGEVLAVVSILDVTDSVIRSSALLETAHKLHQYSNRDPLTGLFNRRFMWDWLTKQLKLAARHAGSISCLIIDVDHFKRLNDTHGHDRGDEVLKALATSLTSRLRESDVVVRYGGEEFVALLPDCAAEEAIDTAERIRQEVANSGVAQLEPGAVTVSIGVACCQPDNPCTGEEMLKRADRRLYDAKNRGRNQVVPAPEGEHEPAPVTAPTLS